MQKHRPDFSLFRKALKSVKTTAQTGLTLTHNSYSILRKKVMCRSDKVYFQVFKGIMNTVGKIRENHFQ